MGDYEEHDTCPIGGRLMGGLAGFGYNFAVDILSKLVQPGTGLDHFVKQTAKETRILPSIKNFQVVSSKTWVKSVLKRYTVVTDLWKKLRYLNFSKKLNNMSQNGDTTIFFKQLRYYSIWVHNIHKNRIFEEI